MPLLQATLPLQQGVVVQLWLAVAPAALHHGARGQESRVIKKVHTLPSIAGKAR